MALEFFLLLYSFYCFFMFKITPSLISFYNFIEYDTLFFKKLTTRGVTPGVIQFPECVYEQSRDHILVVVTTTTSTRQVLYLYRTSKF